MLSLAFKGERAMHPSYTRNAKVIEAGEQTMDKAQRYYEITLQMTHLEERMEARASEALDMMMVDDALAEQEPSSLTRAIAQLAIMGHLFPRLRERFQDEEVQDFLVLFMRDFLLERDD